MSIHHPYVIHRPLLIYPSIIHPPIIHLSIHLFIINYPSIYHASSIRHFFFFISFSPNCSLADDLGNQHGWAWNCSRFLPTGKFFPANVAPCCLFWPSCFFLWLYQGIWNAFGRDLVLCKLKLSPSNSLRPAAKWPLWCHRLGPLPGVGFALWHCGDSNKAFHFKSNQTLFISNFSA